jgi:hypothetical protein
MTQRGGSLLQAILFVVVATFTIVGAGCSSGDDPAPSTDDTPTFNGLDPTVACQSYQVGWNFGTGGSTLANAQGSSLSGIQVVSSDYGRNCTAAAIGNSTLAVTNKCNGEYHCDFVPGLPSDPAYGCRKDFDLSFKCGAESQVYTRHVNGEAGGQHVILDCGPKMTIVSGTYGSNCNVAEGAHTNQLKAGCDALRSCSLPINPGNAWGDPAKNCAKAFTAKWTCGTSTKVYTQTQPGESGGTTMNISCSGVPMIKVKGATYGPICGVAADNALTTVAAQCNDLTTCDYTVSSKVLGDPRFGCKKDFSVRYNCGDNPFDYFVTAPGEADGAKVHLTCEGATGYKPADLVTTTGRRGCVFKDCPWFSKRDENLRCANAPEKVLINSAVVTLFKFYTSDGIDATTLRPNTPYGLLATVKVDGPPVRPKVTPWMTARFVNKSNGSAADGYVCSLTPLDMNKRVNGTTYEFVGTQGPRILSAECYDSRANPYADAAKRLGMSEANFRSAYQIDSSRLHFSIDPQGDFGFQKIAGQDPTLPNGPGFFYDANRNYVDMISYFQQREIPSALTGASAGKNVSDKQYFLNPAKFMYVNLKTARVTDGRLLNLGFFDTASPAIKMDVNWSFTGDTPDNPFSPNASAAAASTGVANIYRRNLRATISAYPQGQDANAVTLGTVALDNGTAEGAVKAGTIAVSDAFRDKVFGAWANTTTFIVRACLDIDGVNIRANQGLDVPNGASVIFQSTCITPDILTVARDYTKRPITPQHASSNIASTKSNASGDSSTSGQNDAAQEKTCTETPAANGMYTQTCTATRRAAMTASGDLGRTYYSTTSATTRTETPQAVTAAPAMKAEALGYQVVDVADVDDDMTWQKGSSVFQSKAPQTITIAPNWDLLVNSLKTSTPPPAQWEKGRYGGQMGLGVGLGFKVPFGGFGLLTIAATVGVSLALEVNLTFKPDVDYPCINSTKTKCFGLLPTAQTQADAHRKCQAKGGRLAEMVTASDKAGIAAAAPGNQNYWIGGQLGYQFADAACARNQSGANCRATSTTTYRWIGSDNTFATQSGTGGPVTLNSTKTTATAAEAQLSTIVPVDGGIQYQGSSHALTTVSQIAVLPGVCEFDGAASTSYQAWNAGLAIGAGAGVSMSFCIPNDEIGLCIDGQLNFIDISLKPLVGNASFTLYDSTGRRFGTRGDTFVDVPWSISLLTGQVNVTANFYFASASWTIARYDGFKIASGSLFHYDWPSREDF